ncbi:MAG: glycosyltransferase family 4 protein [Candidatus Aenigmatarchaeota archaeon]
MKIVQICPFFYPVKGGLEEHVYRISRELVKKGHIVYVFTSNSMRKGKIKKRYEVIDGINVIRFNVFLRLGDFGMFWPGFINYLLKEKPDIVHVHNYRHFHTIFSAILCKIIKKPCIITTHSPFHPKELRRLHSRILVLFYDKILSKVIDKLFDKIIIINNNEKKYFLHLRKDKISLLPNGIDKSFFKKISKKLKLKLVRKLRIRKKDFIVLFIGRIHPTKGLHFLVNTFLKYFCKNNVKLFIAGPIEDTNYYNKKIFSNIGEIKNIFYIGEIFGEEKRALYEISDIVVVPSIYESFGIVILEAFARGKPVIAVDSDGPRYLIENGKNGFLIKFGDEKSLKNYINILRTDKKLYKKIAENNFKKAKKFTWDKIVKKIIKIYEEVYSNYNSL